MVIYKSSIKCQKYIVIYRYKVCYNVKRMDKREYNTLHKYIGRKLTKNGYCSNCKTYGYTEWSNKSGLYLRELIDWQELCKKCHMRYDSNVLGAKFGRNRGTSNKQKPLPEWFIHKVDIARKQVAERTYKNIYPD